MNKSEIIKGALNKSMTYREYRSLIDDLMENNKTTGENHSEAMINYTQLNLARMNKWDKRFIHTVLISKSFHLAKLHTMFLYFTNWQS